MKSILIANTKGGSSKSTTSIALAVCASRSGLRVLLVDADPQKTSCNWFDRRKKCEGVGEGSLVCVSATSPRGIILPADDKDFDLAIFDTAAGQSQLVADLMRRVDFCLVPLRPTLVDIQGTSPIIAALRSAKCSFGFVLTQTYAGHSPRRDETWKLLQGTGLVAPSCLAFRVDHQDAIAQGYGVTEFAPDGMAADETRQLWNWMRGRIADEACAA